MSYPHYSGECHEYHGLVVDFQGIRPEIVTLCGSTKFRDEINAENARLTLNGKLVISLGLFGHSGDLPPEQCAGGEVKIGLDELHKRKIDLADSVHVVDVNGYIGDSTRSEIKYAKRAGKTVTYYSDTHGVTE